MNNYKVSILFVIANNRTRKDNKAPIICRITYKQKRKQFATGQFVKFKFWDSKSQVAREPKEKGFINSQLCLIKQKLNQAFLLLQLKELDFDVNDVYNQFVGKNITSEKTIIDAFDYHIARMQKLVGIEVKQVSVEKYSQTLVHIKSFLKLKHKKSDYLLKDLKLKFLNDFEYYLKTENKFLPNTVYKTLQRVRRVIRVSVGAEYLDKDPFVLHRAKKPKKQIIYLDELELKNLENFKFSQIRLEQVKEMFVFCCYTGLAFQEMSSLKSENIVKGFDGNLWIQMLRQKTDSKFSIPLLPKANEVLEKYTSFPARQKIDIGFLLPRISNQKFNSYLKEIAEIVGIKKNLTHHIARKTFATTVLLYNGVPMEIVSELLGHSKMSITQDHYAKVVQIRVSEEMIKLNKKLS